MLCQTSCWSTSALKKPPQPISHRGRNISAMKLFVCKSWYPMFWQIDYSLGIRTREEWMQRTFLSIRKTLSNFLLTSCLHLSLDLIYSAHWWPTDIVSVTTQLQCLPFKGIDHAWPYCSLVTYRYSFSDHSAAVPTYCHGHDLKRLPSIRSRSSSGISFWSKQPDPRQELEKANGSASSQPGASPEIIIIKNIYSSILSYYIQFWNFPT